MDSVTGVNLNQNYGRRTQDYYNRPQREGVYYSQEQEPSNNFATEKTVVTAGLLQIVAIALQNFSKKCGDILMRGKEFTSFENVKKVADRMVQDNKLNVSVHYINKDNIRGFPHNLQGNLAPVARGENAFYMDSIKLAVAPEKKPSLILHELGHAINATKGKFLRFLQKSRMYTAYVPTAVLLANNMFKDSGYHSDFIEKHAGTIGFLSFLPTIVEEGLASIRGVNAAKKVFGNSVNLKALKKNYFAAWLTYLISGVGLGVASKLAVVQNKTE